MKQLFFFTLAALCLTLLCPSCQHSPVAQPQDTVLLSLRTGTSTPAEVIDKLGSPISKELVAGGEVLTFSYPGEVLRVFVDRPGSDQDYVIMIHGPKDPLCLVFSGGVLTSAYKKMPLPRKSRR